jgi:hypothetical protein
VQDGIGSILASSRLAIAVKYGPTMSPRSFSYLDIEICEEERRVG